MFHRIGTRLEPEIKRCTPAISSNLASPFPGSSNFPTSQKNMPIIAPGSRVLVTGANGFAAVHIVSALLEKGYSVRAAVRSESKGVHLRKLFGRYGNEFELVVVPDITKVRLIPARRGQTLWLTDWILGRRF